VDRIITYDYGRPGGPKAQREEVYRQVRAERPDWIINPMSLRSPISERIVRYCHARVRVGLAERPRPGHRRPRARFDRYYSHLVYDPAFTPWTSEISLQKALFRAMGLEPGDGRPRIWTAPEDAAFAEAFYRERNLQPGRTLVYFSTASSPLRSYPRLKSILADMLQGNSWSAIALGGEREYEANHPPSPALAARWINLCGQTTMAKRAKRWWRIRSIVIFARENAGTRKRIVSPTWRCRSSGEPCWGRWRTAETIRVFISRGAGRPRCRGRNRSLPGGTNGPGRRGRK
jgi:ADP-heptose:LPS heptosyltransferase